MLTLNRIDEFGTSIYSNMPSRINEDYLSICTEFDSLLASISQDEDVSVYRQRAMNELLIRMESGDFIKMAEGLYLVVAPAIEKLGIGDA